MKNETKASETKASNNTRLILLEEGNQEVTSIDIPLDKAQILQLLKEATTSSDGSSANLSQPPIMPKYEDYVFIRKGEGYKKVATMDIVYLEAGRNYCDIYLSDGTCLNVTLPMNEVYEYLCPRLFKRVHRSFVVNLEHVETYMGNMLRLTNVGQPITIGRDYREVVKSQFVCIGSRKRIREKDS